MTNDRPNWHGRPYYSLDSYLKNTYGEKIYKIALNAGFTCPNRDGSLDTRGCIFCSAGGSGEYAVPMKGKSIDRQLEEGLRLFHGKKTGNRFIAYFQAYTNTYAPAEQLRLLYSRALSHAQIAGISIATRPDCLPCADKRHVLNTLHRELKARGIRQGMAVNNMRKETQHDAGAIYNL